MIVRQRQRLLRPLLPTVCVLLTARHIVLQRCAFARTATAHHLPILPQVPLRVNITRRVCTPRVCTNTCCVNVTLRICTTRICSTA